MNKERDKKSRLLIKLIFSGSIIIGAIALILMFTITPPIKKKIGEVPSTAPISGIGGDFVLTDGEGKPFDSRNMRGQVALIYFGFTFCPDICPASLGEMAAAIDLLGEDAKNMKFLFITIDPKRDDPENLRKYFAEFDDRITPLTGTEKEIEGVAKMFKVYYSIADDKHAKDKDNYLVNHSSFFYLVGKNGEFIRYYSPGVKGTEIAADIKKHL